MKTIKEPTKVFDEVIAEVHATKRDIAARHNNDVSKLVDALMAQEQQKPTAENCLSIKK